MKMTRVYSLSVAEIITLQEVMKEYSRELDCECRAKDDLCDHCQRNYDLIQKLTDSRSLAEVGVSVVFTNDREILDKIVPDHNPKQEMVQ